MAGAGLTAQRGVERERMAGEGDGGGEGQVRLVDVAGLDMSLHRGERGAIFVPADQRPRRA